MPSKVGTRPPSFSSEVPRPPASNFTFNTHPITASLSTEPPRRHRHYSSISSTGTVLHIPPANSPDISCDESLVSYMHGPRRYTMSEDSTMNGLSVDESPTVISHRRVKTMDSEGALTLDGAERRCGLSHHEGELRVVAVGMQSPSGLCRYHLLEKRLAFGCDPKELERRLTQTASTRRDPGGSHHEHSQASKVDPMERSSEDQKTGACKDMGIPSSSRLCPEFISRASSQEMQQVGSHRCPDEECFKLETPTRRGSVHGEPLEDYSNSRGPDVPQAKIGNCFSRCRSSGMDGPLPDHFSNIPRSYKGHIEASRSISDHPRLEQEKPEDPLSPDGDQSSSHGTAAFHGQRKSTLMSQAPQALPGIARPLERHIRRFATEPTSSHRSSNWMRRVGGSSANRNGPIDQRDMSASETMGIPRTSPSRAARDRKDLLGETTAVSSRMPRLQGNKRPSDKFNGPKVAYHHRQIDNPTAEPTLEQDLGKLTCTSDASQHYDGIDAVPSEPTHTVDFSRLKRRKAPRRSHERDQLSQPSEPKLFESPAQAQDSMLQSDSETGSFRGYIRTGARKVLHRASHMSLRSAKGFNFTKGFKPQPDSRDWSPARKRYVAAVACLGTAVIGFLLGIYAGLVPAIQYYVVDQNHRTLFGNVGCFLAMAFTTFFCWPLPLLHGRKPYILVGFVVSLPLLFPQALAVSEQRSTAISEWRGILIGPRVLMGASLGFASMNFHSVLTDLFGASLMSHRPHQEAVDNYDARRHGGGMGVWLGIWTWCWIASLTVGFLVGAIIIDHKPPVWGFYVSIVVVGVILLLNVATPEVRPAAYRRSVAELRNAGHVSQRLARGEVKMHRVKRGPIWWGEEAYHGVCLSFDMLRQPGFLIMSIYTGWAYAQVVLAIILLGSLTSQLYRFRSPVVGAIVASLASGALLAVPFQKANIFSRSRRQPTETNRSLHEKAKWTSHLVRRAVFTILLPVFGALYATFSMGPPTHVALPIVFAGGIGFLSCLAISECNGLIMETFDCSDLEHGMLARRKTKDKLAYTKINYSSLPRVSAAFACCQTFAFLFAGAATSVGAAVQRNMGQRAAAAIVATILLVLSILLLLALIRFKDIQIIPDSHTTDMDNYTAERSKSQAEGLEPLSNPFTDDVLPGHPVSKTRRVNMLELGAMSRWTEIRKENRLIDEDEKAHLNRQALRMASDSLNASTSSVFRMGGGGSRRQRSSAGRDSDQSGGVNDLTY